MLPVAFGYLLILLALSIPIAAVLGTMGLFLGEVYSPIPLYRAMGDIFWENSNDFLIVSVPLFILLGEIILRAKIAERMYGALAQWLSWLPGGLMHSNIGSCAMFAATSGSSVATAATIGTVAMPEVKKRGYNEPLFLGSLVSGGTLGILIPPSINMIVYALITKTSVPQLYLAGFLPGILMAVLFMGAIVVATMVKPQWGGEKIKTSWEARFRSLKDLVPPLMIFGLVVGTIYAGVATPTEAASLGVVGALGLAWANGSLSIEMLRESIEGTMKTTGMTMLIMLAAIFLNFVLAATGLTRFLSDFVLGLGLGPMETMLVLVAFFLVLGCFMETFSMMLLTAPLVAPIVAGLGFDLVWFGILLMVLLETALITPPIGVNLYVVQAVRGRGSMTDVMKGAMPFMVSMLLMVALLLIFPDIALWLPKMFY